MPAKHLIVPVDFEQQSSHALEVATDFAETLRADLTVVHVIEIPSYAYFAQLYSAYDCLAPLSDAARSRLEESLVTVRRRVPGVKAMLRTGVPWQEIVAAIGESGADLVVIGTHGRAGVPRALLGSVAEKIVRLSPVPVLTVRAPV